ncbi:hypothetical protein M3Y95_00446800 [Aphelenchoides besseyi]|nr:hypothetical protein M3Y95_00446800 [Aphelenchoides besseyi]
MVEEMRLLTSSFMRNRILPSSVPSFILVFCFTSLFTCPPTVADLEFLPLTREFIEMIDDPDRYNKYATPTQFQGSATNVSMSMYIEGISSFSAQTMDYNLDAYFYQEWEDSRLAHNGTGPMLIRDKAVFAKIWHPDAYFANARSASFHTVTESNFLAWVYPDGHVWYDCRISLTAICMMDLWKYPLDAQECNLRILSYAYPESQVRLHWSTTIEPPIDRNMGIRMPDMRLIDIKTGLCDGTYTTGKWSCMTAIFYVQREMMHHVIQTYIPTGLIVVISWFNFWLDIDSAPARVSLSITTLLTISTQANAVKLSLPEVSYMKAIDCWLGACLVFVFGVMVEFTLCHFAKNREMSCGNERPPANLVVDTTFSSLFGSTPSADQTNSTQTSIPIVEDPRNKKTQRNGHPIRMEDPTDPRMAPLADQEAMLLKGDSYNGAGDPRLIDLHPDLIYRYNHLSNSLGNNVQSEPLRVNDQRNMMRPTVNKLKSQVNRRALNWRTAVCNLRGRRVATKIDETCRYLFPLAFLAFNLTYWAFYLVFN